MLLMSHFFLTFVANYFDYEKVVISNGHCADVSNGLVVVNGQMEANQDWQRLLFKPDSKDEVGKRRPGG